MKRVLYVIIVLNIINSSSNVFAQFDTEVSGVGTHAAEFLAIGVGARAMALGGAYAAVANDPTALYYNPAGIVWMDNIQIEIMHNEWLVDTDYDFIGATMPLPFWNSSIGVSFIMLNFGEQPVRTVDRPEGTGETYSAASYAIAFTFASALTDNFSFGLSGKYIQEKIWHVTGGAAAIDLGIFYNTPFKGLRLGMSMSNYGGELSLSGRDLDTTVDPDDENDGVWRVPVAYKTNGFPLPLLFRFGLSYVQELGTLGSVLLATDLNHPSNSTESINLGIEYNYGGTVFLRAGYESLYEKDAINGLTLGGGIDYSLPGFVGFRVDYAFSDWGPFESAHRFSLGLAFN